MKLNLLFVTIVIGVLFIALIHVYFDASYVLQQNESAILKSEPIKVVSYNIRYGKGQDDLVDIQRTIQKLRSIEADIISLQEVERYSLRSGFRDQVELIAKELHMNAVFYPTLAYPGLYYGNAVFSRFPVKSSTHFPFASQTENRSMIIAQIEVSEDQVVYLLNTHLGLNKEERERHFQQMYGVISTLDAPIILTGDLNTTPDQKEYLIWDDILTKSNLGSFIKTYYKKDWQIDYIFHSAHFEVLGTETYESDTSDHFPIAAILNFR